MCSLSVMQCGVKLASPSAGPRPPYSGFRCICRRLAPAGLAFISAVLLTACGAGSAEVTGCSGFADKVAITRDEYGPCAQEIMLALDTLQEQLRELVRGNTANAQEARETSRRLEMLWRQAGRSNPRLPASAFEIWPDERVRRFNSFSQGAYRSYKTTLRYVLRPPGFPFNIREQFNEGSRLHAEAGNAYRRSW